MKYLICFILFISSTWRVNAQLPDFTPPSPTAASMARVFEMPINSYRGRTDIDIPLYTAKERTLSTSISLTYTGGSGIKVQDVAGPAGLGWALNAGGVITRTVRDMLDEDPAKGYCTPAKAGLNSATSSTAFQDAMKSQVGFSDVEPDKFNSSIGGGIVFNSNKQAYFTRDQGYIIKKNGLFSADSTWEVVDTRGNRYIFGKNAVEREHSGFYSSRTADPSPYISSWYLSEIISIEGEIIKFTYIKGSPSYYEFTANTRTISTQTIDQPAGANVYIYDPVFLKEIICSNSKLIFSYNERWDIMGQRAIEKIVVNDKSGTLKTAFRFINGYFSDGQGNAYARHKLMAVEQLSSDQKKFIRIAGFNYNEMELLPPRSSPQFDHWGYYNNNTTGQRLKSMGAIKTSDSAKAKANILTSIDWPHGGKTEYEYELNTYRRNDVNQAGGGVRIKKIKVVHDGKTSETSYSYVNENGVSSGLLPSRFNPDSGYVSSYHYTYFFPNGGVIYIVDQLIETECDIPMFELLDINSNAVGYSRVEVTYPDQSKEVQLFQDYNDFPNNESGVFITNNSYLANISSTYSPNKQGILDFFTENVLQRGLIKQTELFDAAGNRVSKTVYQYDSKARTTSPVIRGVKKRISGADTPENGSEPAYTWIAAVYEEHANTPQLLSKEEFIYVQGSQSIAVKRFARWEYHNGYPFLVSKQTDLSSNGDSIITITRYPPDIVTSQVEVVSYMVDLNILDPLEKITRNKSTAGEFVTGAQLNLYSGTPSRILPASIQKLEITAPVSNYQLMSIGSAYDARCNPQIIYDLYASSGELLQYHEHGNVIQSIIWGYKNKFPVAHIIGVPYDIAVQYIDSALLNSLTLSDASMRVELEKLRQNLPSAIIKTFTYDPLKGLTSETDPAGKSKFYEYDDFLRLSTIKDMDGKILKKFEYYVTTSGGWQDTQVKRCLTNSNGEYTGEEEVQQIDEDPSSSTYHQTRWRSLGFTSSCNNAVYAKIKLEGWSLESFNDDWDQRFWSLEYQDVKVYFYKDPACTIPTAVSNLYVTYSLTPSSGGPMHPGYTGRTILCNGTSTVLDLHAIQREFTVDFPPAEYRYHYMLTPGNGYIIKQ